MLIKPILDDFSLVAFTSRLHDDILLLVFILVVSALLSWRVIKFTILPRWFKDDPKELPYWIPGKTQFYLLNKCSNISG